MWKALFALFMIAHGLVHTLLAAAPNPSDPEAKTRTFFTSPFASIVFLSRRRFSL